MIINELELNHGWRFSLPIIASLSNATGKHHLPSKKNEESNCHEASVREAILKVRCTAGRVGIRRASSRVALSPQGKPVENTIILFEVNTWRTSLGALATYAFKPKLMQLGKEMAA